MDAGNFQSSNSFLSFASKMFFGCGNLECFRVFTSSPTTTSMSLWAFSLRCEPPDVITSFILLKLSSIARPILLSLICSILDPRKRIALAILFKCSSQLGYSSLVVHQY